jgi:YHS domain-containing protein
MWYLRLTVIGFFLGAAAAFAADPDKHDHSKMPAAKPAGNPTLAQKTCPVTGKPIRKDFSVEQDGLKVYFCCPSCPPKFKESPTEYLPAVYRQVYPQNVQVNCPVMGGPLDGKTFIEYQGRQIGFCCDGCPEKFKADPAKYLANKKQWTTEQVHCPVTGKAIEPKVRSEYQGKTVYFSTEEAQLGFKADPARYTAALRPEAGIVARGPTADEDLVLCLTSPTKGSIYKRKDLKPTAYEGKTYFLRGDDGLRTFQVDPAGYARALDVEMKKRQSDLNKWFTCSMHPNVRQQGPGKCRICGMDLTPVENTGAKNGHRIVNRPGMDHAGMQSGGHGQHSRDGDHAGHRH